MAGYYDPATAYFRKEWKKKDMKSKVSLSAGLLLVMSIVLAACGGAPAAATPVPPTTAPTAVPPTTAPAPQPTPSKPAALQIAQNATLGQFLADDQGRTLYIFLKDTKDTSTCYDACAQTWPPLLTLGQPTAGQGIDASLLGTTQRKDGTTQVTFNGYPLYYYAPDQQPGDTKGQGVKNVWYVISPAGRIIKPAALKVTQNTTLGQILTDDQGRTLYLFLNDTGTTSTCYDACAKTWPPLMTAGQPTAGDGVNASLLSTTQRTDGTTQVTYNGHPLYYFANDAQPGDSKGQGVKQVWYVVSPAGDAIKK